MAYNELLDEMIKESKLSYVEVTKELEKKGIKRDRSFVGKLVKKQLKVPDEEISIALAEICKRNPSELVLEGYLNDAPKLVIDALNNLKTVTAISTLNALRNKIDYADYSEIREKFNKLPLSDFLLGLMNNNEYKVHMEQKNVSFKLLNDKLTVNIIQPKEISVNDNILSPFITINHKVGVEAKNKYNDRDIIAVRVNGNKEHIIRQAIFLGNEVILTGLNNLVKEERYPINDIKIIGKVTRIITVI